MKKNISFISLLPRGKQTVFYMINNVREGDESQLIYFYYIHVTHRVVQKKNSFKIMSAR